jgi:sulfide:quinone oxidoreductase
MNHLGKMVFRWVYWNILLKGYALPVSTQMSMAGKEL